MSKPIKLSEIKQQNCYVQCDTHSQAYVFMLHAGLYLEGKLNEEATIVSLFGDGTCILLTHRVIKNKTVYKIDNIDLNN
jgi:hypothetical protein